MKKRIALVGCGRMGGAMLRGWGPMADRFSLVVFEPYPSGEVSEVIATQNWALNPDPAESGNFECVVLGIKPQLFPTIGDQTIRHLLSDHTLVLSIMAGIPTAKITEVLSTSQVIRAMPNTPGQIGKGVTAYWNSPTVSPEAEDLAVSLLRPLGTVEKLQSEKQLDAVTAVSGSGPAYVFLLAEAMAAAGEAEGLDRAMAERLAWQTVIGAAALMEQTGQNPQDLRRAVTSPEGTTAAATDALTAGGGIVTLVRRAVEAAIHRSRQLGK
jgi:pyrroline-5-carboxylate reductase